MGLRQIVSTTISEHTKDSHNQGHRNPSPKAHATSDGVAQSLSFLIPSSLLVLVRQRTLRVGPKAKKKAHTAPKNTVRSRKMCVCFVCSPKGPLTSPTTRHGRGPQRRFYPLGVNSPPSIRTVFRSPAPLCLYCPHSNVSPYLTKGTQPIPPRFPLLHK